MLNTIVLSLFIEAQKSFRLTDASFTNQINCIGIHNMNTYVFYIAECILFFCVHSCDTRLFDFMALSFFSAHQTQQPLVSLK